MTAPKPLLEATPGRRVRRPVAAAGEAEVENDRA
jgi:hypothetical protein